MPLSSVLDATNAYSGEPAMVVIDFGPFSSVKPFELSATADAGVGRYGFVMSMI